MRHWSQVTVNTFWPSEPVPQPMQGEDGCLCQIFRPSKEIASGRTFSTDLTNHHRSAFSERLRDMEFDMTRGDSSSDHIAEEGHNPLMRLAAILNRKLVGEGHHPSICGRMRKALCSQLHKERGESKGPPHAPALLFRPARGAGSGPQSDADRRNTFRVVGQPTRLWSKSCTDILGSESTRARLKCGIQRDTQILCRLT